MTLPAQPPKLSMLLSIGAAFTAFSFAPEIEAKEDDLFDSEIPTVLTPTRLKQALADVPGSVTVITAEMMERFGISSIADALRFVPGMAVMQVTGNDFRINYHGSNALYPRRMNVLIDGVSAYRSAVGALRVDWNELPVDIQDIARIEVTRGPNSASYGTNSMLAIINIITKHPEDVEGTTLTTRIGSLHTRQGSARHAGKIGEATAYRVTVSHQADDGFDINTPAGADHDGSRINRLNFRVITNISNHETLDLQASVVQGLKQIAYVDAYQKSTPDIRLQDINLSALWRKNLSENHTLQVQTYFSQHRNHQDWTTCPPAAMLLPEMFSLWRANPAYARALLAGKIPSGGTPQDDVLAQAAYAAIRKLGAQAAQPVCARPNQHYIERRYDVELQDTYVFSKALRMVSGAGFRQDMGDSQTFFAGRVSNNSFRLFSNVEYKPYRWLNVNAGGYLERDQLTGASFSPRIAVNTHLSDYHTLRFVVSKGTRMPGISDQKGNWTYDSTVGRFFQSAVAPGNLSPENVISREIGYLGNLPQYGLIVDAKLFDDKLYHLISEKLQISDFAPTNNNWAHLRGAELQINVEPNERWMGFFTYAYLGNRASTILEKTQNLRHSGSLGLTHKLNRNWRLSLSSSGNSGSAIGQSFYGRKDLTLVNTARLHKGARLASSFTVRHLNNRASAYFVDFTSRRESSYKASMQYLLTMELAF